ncbi:hypothetical protein HK099_000610, partial [Clydaea vesicula]
QSFPQLKTIFSSSNYPRVSHSSSESTLPNFIATVIHSLTSIKTNKIPNRSLVEYIRFILSSTKVSASTIITSLKYLQRLSYQFKIVQGQEWKLYLTSLILSDSFLSDSPFELKCWIKLGGIKGSELAILKTFFLNSISFRLFVDDTEYFGWLSVLEMDLTKFNCNLGFIDNNNKWRAILRCVCCGLMIHYDSVQRNIQQGNARDEHLKNESVHFCTGKDPTKKCKDREALAKFAKTMNLIEVTPVLVSYSISPHQHKNQNPSEKVIKKRKADNTIIKVEEATKLCNVSYDFMRPKMNREGLEWLEEQRRLNLSILISFSLVNNMSSPDLSTHVTDTDSNSVSSPSSSTHYGSNYDALSETTHTSISIDQFLADTSDFYLPLQHNNNSIFNQPLSKNTRKNKMNESADSISLTEIKEEKLDSPVIKSEEDVGSSSSATPISIPVISFSSIDDIQNNVNNIHSNKDNQGETSNSSLTTPVFPFVKISRSASNTAESDHSHDNGLISIKRSSSLPSSYSEVIPDISNEVDLASELPPYVVDAPVMTAKENRISGKVISKDEELSKDSSSNIQFVKTKVNLEDDSELINITDGLKELKVGENEKQQQKKGEKGWKSVTDSLKNMFFSKESSVSLKKIFFFKNFIFFL